jgi:hypothetical protein
MSAANPSQGGEFKVVEDQQWHVVHITLSKEQQVELERLTGLKLERLNIAVEELADLGDLIAN